MEGFEGTSRTRFCMDTGATFTLAAMSPLDANGTPIGYGYHRVSTNARTVRFRK